MRYLKNKAKLAKQISVFPVVHTHTHTRWYRKRAHVRNPNPKKKKIIYYTRSRRPNAPLRRRHGYVTWRHKPDSHVQECAGIRAESGSHHASLWTSPDRRPATPVPIWPDWFVAALRNYRNYVEVVAVSVGPSSKLHLFRSVFTFVKLVSCEFYRWRVN